MGSSEPHWLCEDIRNVFTSEWSLLLLTPPSLLCVIRPSAPTPASTASIFFLPTLVSAGLTPALLKLQSGKLVVFVPVFATALVCVSQTGLLVLRIFVWGSWLGFNVQSTFLSGTVGVPLLSRCCMCSFEFVSGCVFRSCLFCSFAEFGFLVCLSLSASVSVCGSFSRSVSSSPFFNGLPFKCAKVSPLLQLSSVSWWRQTRGPPPSASSSECVRGASFSWFLLTLKRKKCYYYW